MLLVDFVFLSGEVYVVFVFVFCEKVWRVRIGGFFSVYFLGVDWKI